MVDTVLDLEKDMYLNVGYLIRRVHQIADAIFEREMRELGLTPVQYGILVAVAAHSGIDQYQLGRAIGIDRTTISYVVRKLKTKGLVDAAKDASDRRSNLLRLTPRGEEVLAEALPIAQKASHMFLHGVTDAERQQLAVTLKIIVHAHEAQATPPVITKRQREAVARD